MHADVLEYARSLGRRVSASELRRLQGQYDRGMLRLDRLEDRQFGEDRDSGSSLWRNADRHGSRAVDALGDEIVRRLANSR